MASADGIGPRSPSERSHFCRVFRAVEGRRLSTGNPRRALRFFVLQITALMICAVIAVSSGYAASFSFVSMADSRGTINGVNDYVLSTIVDAVVQTDADFIFFPGDLVNGSNNEATLASQLNHWRDVMAPAYSSDMYGAKVYAGPGNHEIWNSGSEAVWQAIFSDLPSNGPTGETYMTYSFDYLNSHFVMLNTDRAGMDHTINYDWLVNDLAATDADHIFVFGHEPAYPAGPHLRSSLDAYPDQRDAFWQLLVDHNVDIYFAGHEHLYNHIEVDGVHQVIAGTCGAPIYGGYGGDFYHYALITVDGLDASVRIFDDNLEMRDSFEYRTVPAPSTINLLGFGLIGLAGFRRASAFPGPSGTSGTSSSRGRRASTSTSSPVQGTVPSVSPLVGDC